VGGKENRLFQLAPNIHSTRGHHWKLFEKPSRSTRLHYEHLIQESSEEEAPIPAIRLTGCWFAGAWSV